MAVLCEHQEVAPSLSQRRKPDIKDESGETPRDSFNEELRRAATNHTSES